VISQSCNQAYVRGKANRLTVRPDLVEPSEREKGKREEVVYQALLARRRRRNDRVEGKKPRQEPTSSLL